LAIGSSFLAVLAGSPLGASTATLLRRWRLAGALPGRLGVSGAVGDSLLGLDPVDGHADPLPVGPLDGVVGLGIKGPVGVGDLVTTAVVLDLGGGVAPGSPASG
jgi:hypothetical protein